MCQLCDDDAKYGHLGGSDPVRAKKTFEITYFDPDEKEFVTVEKQFDDSPEFPARMWADDWAYMAADKRGDYTIKEVKT